MTKRRGIGVALECILVDGEVRARVEGVRGRYQDCVVGVGSLLVFREPDVWWSG